MQLFKETHIDFMKWRRVWIGVSALFLLLGLVSIFWHGEINMGIDFVGGTQLTVRFAEQPQVDELRKVVEQAGIGAASIQRFGEVTSNEVMIKTPVKPGTEEGRANEVVAALSQRYNGGAQGFDLNQKGRDATADLLFQLDPDHVAKADEATARTHYTEVADAVMKTRRTNGLFRSYDEISGPAISPEVVTALKGATTLGKFAVVSLENVGPQVGKELRTKGMLAVGLSLIGMLIYIWFRFELRFGIGAVMASIHDVIVTVGLFALAGFEFNLTTVAAFLTLVGYSVNDTVVIFDRVRENMRKNRRQPLIEVMNDSLNQTLSRTIMTSLTVFIATLTLLLLGGDVIRGFAFIMTVGVVVGTYSSIYIASPFALLWDKYFGSKGSKIRGGEPAAAAVAAGRAAARAGSAAPAAGDDDKPRRQGGSSAKGGPRRSGGRR